MEKAGNRRNRRKFEVNNISKLRMAWDESWKTLLK